MQTQTTTGARKGTSRPPLTVACLGMRKLLKEYDAATSIALEVGVRIGNHAIYVKEDLLKHGQFTPWVIQNFGPDSERPMSHQWVTTCMRAAKAMAILEGRPDKGTILTAVDNRLERLASILPRLKDEEPNPLDRPFPRVARMDPTIPLTKEVREFYDKAALLCRLAKGGAPLDHCVKELNRMHLFYRSK